VENACLLVTIQFSCNLTVVLFQGVIWSVTLRTELRVFEKRAMRIYGSKREEERGGWTK
jgi:hypothetical protein